METIVNHMKFKIVILTFLFAFACAEKTTVVVGDAPHPSKPPGLIVASDKALENGKKHLRKGNCGKAIKEFEKALEKNPNNFEALYWLGVAEGMCGYYGRAYDRFVLALRRSSDRGWQARVNATIGLTLLYMGRDDDAVVYFERARVIDPRNEIIVAYYDWDTPEKGPKKPKIKKKPKDREGFEITLRWLD